MLLLPARCPLKIRVAIFTRLFTYAPAMRRSLADLLAYESVLRQATIELTYLLKQPR